MHIACSIYVLIALSFLCTVLAQELGGDIDVVKLAKKVKKNIKNIRKLDTNLEDLNEEITDLGDDLNDLDDDLNDLDDDLNDLDRAVTGVEEKMEVLNVDVLKLDEKFTNDIDEAVTGLEEKHDEAVTGLEEKIKLLEEALEVARKVEEIQFFGVASQSTTYQNFVAMNSIDGSKSNIEFSHTAGGDTDPYWKLSFTNDVVINRIMIYSGQALMYTAGNRVSILSSTGAIVWGYTIEKEKKKVYVIDVPNVVGQTVKIDKPVNGYIIMREIAVFGLSD